MPSRINPYTPGQFYINPIHPPDPGAQTEMVYVIPAGYPLELISLAFLFVADANVADRYISFNLEDAVPNIYASSNLYSPVTAGLALPFSVGAGQPSFFDPAAPLAVTLAWPIGLIGPGGYRYTIRVANMQVGDSISNIYGITHQFYST